ncbi:hypothetical protein [Amycolatopsis panacis]|uniref:DUF4231 domain-containing protein n=1 Tax=Amycolatopsis panacis TaxID=2340917 RepID=A0A419IBT1_9PSEU|nr:hypothetical protein [Amycolatopsis panacis]RJQ92764.1 hypothetical protein D5S19_00160 [Amycolatopsis panacis]
MSDQGAVYLAFIEGELKAERERRSVYDARGQALVATSSALVTLLSGLAAVAKAGTTIRVPASSTAVLVAAIALFVCAAASGIVAGWNRHYALASFTTLNRMLNEHWTDDEVDARNNVATVHALTVRTLRRANAFKAACVSIGLVAQVLALTALGATVLIVIGVASS